MLDKSILMQCRICKIIWLTVTDNDTISMSNGHSFSTDPFWVLLRYYQLLKWMENIWDFLTETDQLEKIFYV